MKKIIVMVVFFLGVANAQSVVKVLEAPARAGGLTFDGRHLWTGLYGSGHDFYIFKVDTSNGALIDTLLAPRDDCYGLTFDGEHLYFLYHYFSGDQHVYIMDTTGNVLDSLTTPVLYMAGISFDGADLWIAAYYNPDGMLYKVDKNDGNVIKTIPAPDNQPWGLAFDGSNLWMVDYYGNMIYEIDTSSGTVNTSFPSPGANPTGATWDGHYLWIVAKNPQFSTGWAFFKIDVTGNGTPDIFLPDTIVDFGAVSIGDTGSENITIFNHGDGILVIDSVVISDSVFFENSAQFPDTINPQESSALSVYFSSSIQGEFSSLAYVYSNDPDEPVIAVHLNAVSVAGGPQISVNDSILFFGDNYVGGLKKNNLIVSNSGIEQLRIDSMRISSTNFSLDSIHSPLFINPLESETLSVYFSPTETGQIEDTLLIFSNDSEYPIYHVILIGQGIPDQFSGGELLWSYQGPDNVVSSSYFVDPETHVPVVIFDSYDAGVTGPNLYAIRANSFGEGIPLWTQDLGGGWGEGGLKGVSDLNGDGFPDVIHGSAWGDRSIYALSGLDGSIIWYYDTKIEDGHGGWVYSVDTLSDVTGDSVPEVIAGVGGWNSGTMGPRCVYVFNGTTGEILFRSQANDAVISVCSIPDVDGDGFDDIVAGAGGNATRDHHVYLISGNPAENGRLIWSYDTGNDLWWVSSINDINGDGINDVVAGNWGGKVIALSGQNGDLLWERVVSNVVMKVVPIGDVSGDGIEDVAVGSWSNKVEALSGNNGNVLWTVYTSGDVWTVARVPDLDGDGYDDVAAGSFDNTLYVISGQTGNIIWTFSGNNKFFTVLSIPDVNNDGYAEVGGGTQMLGGNGGTFYLLSGGEVTPSVHEINPRPVFKIFPTISRSGKFVLRLEKPAPVKIFDSSGRLIKEIYVTGSRHICLSKVGIYFVKLKEHTEKIIVVK